MERIKDMSPQLVLDLVYRAIFTAAKMAAPILITAIVVGVLVNIIQTVTSIRDMSLTFVPKVVVAAIVLGLTLPWCLGIIKAFFEEMYMMLGVVSP